MTGLTRLMLGPLVAVAVSSTPGPQTSTMWPPLSSATNAGWERYAAAVRDRMDRELKSTKGFLALDFGSSRAADRASIIAGSIPIVQMVALDAKGLEIEVKDGWVHDWRGAVLLRGVKLDDLFFRLRTAIPGTGKGDVITSSILGREDDPATKTYNVRTYMKIQRKYYFTFVYNTYHDVEFKRRDATHGSSRSVANRIAQLGDVGTPTEYEYIAGKDDGYLWRWNSYWRYEETPQGVIAECESVSLSKSVLAVIRPLARSFASDAAQESMTRALQNLKDFAATGPGTRPGSSPVR